MNPETKPTSEKANTPLFIGAGIEITGSIRHAGPEADRGVILGSFTGDVDWNGVLHVPAGGKVIVEKSMICRELQVAGSIEGASDDVVVEAGLLRLAATAAVDVANVLVPIGGLEQSRGSTLNGKLRMAKESRYAVGADNLPDAPAVPRLVLAASSAGPTSTPDSEAEAGAATTGEGAPALLAMARGSASLAA